MTHAAVQRQFRWLGVWTVFGCLLFAGSLSAQDSAPQLVSKTAGGVPWKDMAELKAAAGTGDVRACAQLGEQLLRGDRVPQDAERAIALLEQAARGGAASAAFRLGMVLDEGELVVQDRVRALAYFRAAAVGEHAEAYHNVGAAYAGAHGVKRNYPEALGWLILAVKHGVGAESEKAVRAQIAKRNHPEWIAAGETRASEIERELAAGSVASFLPPPSPFKYIGPPPSSAPAPAGDKSVRVGQITMMNDAAGTPSPSLADQMVKPAETSSTPPVKLISPLGRPLQWPNYEALEKAAASGDVAALAGLGQVLLEGKLVPENPERAVELLERSAKAGNADAAQLLADLYTRGGKIPTDAAKAFQYGLQAAHGGSPQAMFNTGALLANGLGAERNFTEALAWLITAKHYGLDRGSEQRIRDYLTKTKPDQIPLAEKRAEELQREIDAVRNRAQ